MNVGWIGLGTLGRAMAGRMLSQGTALTVWNRTRRKCDGLGAPAAKSPADLAASCDVVFLSLFDTDAVLAVLGGPDGLLSCGARDRIIVDTTTNHVERVRECHALATRAGARYLEAPVLGSVVPATQGALTILVSGEQPVFEKARPLIAILGSKIFFMGEPGMASRMKLVNNLVLGCFMAAIAEAVATGERAGIDRATLLEILEAGAGQGGVLRAKKTKLLDRDFSPHFSSALIHKDLVYLQDLARSLGQPLVMGSAARWLFALAVSKGLGPEDFSGVGEAM